MGDAITPGSSPLGPRWDRLFRRHPWLLPIARWGPSISSLALGLAVLFVFRRGLPHVGWIVGYLLLLWLLVAVLAQAQAPLERRGRHLVVGAAEYTIQTLCHGLLLFVLPAYYASATLDSPNALMLLALAAGGLVTAVDPWHGRLVAPRPWARQLLLGLSMFAALNVALPLVRVPPGIALLASAGLAGLGVAPALRRLGTSWAVAVLKATGLAALAVAGVWYGTIAIPPAPLFLTRAVVARDVAAREPLEPVRGSVTGQMLREWGGLVAYTAIRAPAGLREGIEHVWSRDGAVVARIPLAQVLGGRAEGFRTFSRRRDWPPPVEGRYRVDVMTASGQLVGRLRFQVVP